MARQSEDYYLIDASIYIFQSHFSPYVESYDESGNELSAVFGFTSFLLQFLRRVRPNYVGVAMDSSLFCGFRHQLCPNYKSNRELPDENLAMQLVACAEVCELLGLSAYTSKKYEADDIIGTLAEQIWEETQGNAALGIVSRDKDLSQLLRSDEHYLWDYSGNKKKYRKHIKDEFGVAPEQFPDYLGLVGDGVDGISGIPGVGPVKAKELLKNFHDLDGIYQNLKKVPSLSIRGAKGLPALLEKHRELAELSKLLATIVCDAHQFEADQAESFVGIDSLALATRKADERGFEDFLNAYSFQAGDQFRLTNQLKGLVQG